jgi:hypothetical protein
MGRRCRSWRSFTFLGDSMKIRRAITATAAAALVGTGAFVLPAVASAGPAAHTLKFISVQKASVQLSKTMFAQQDTDVNGKGKVIGYDELYVAVTSSTTGDGWFTGDVDGGFIYGTFRLNLKTGAATDGKVTGGARAFKEHYSKPQMIEKKKSARAASNASLYVEYGRR